MGVAAMLKNSWTDCPYKIASLIDRKPVSEDDNIIVIAAPDPLGGHICTDLNSSIQFWSYINIHTVRYQAQQLDCIMKYKRLMACWNWASTQVVYLLFFSQWCIKYDILLFCFASLGQLTPTVNSQLGLQQSHSTVCTTIKYITLQWTLGIDNHCCVLTCCTEWVRTSASKVFTFL